MFGNNTIVGRKFFANRPLNSLKVTSVFFTIQGEGPYAGQPAVFVRLTHCNLRCHFCDTFFDSGEYYPYDQLEYLMIKSMHDFFGTKPGDALPMWLQRDDTFRALVVFTGGEPGLQAEELQDFIDTLCPSWAGEFQIESNGLRDLPFEEAALVISPKCAEDKDGNVKSYLKPTARNLEEAVALKFVVSADPESPYHTIPEWAFQWGADRRSSRIFISPMNVYNDLPQKAKDLRARTQEVTLAERSTVDEVISFWEPGLLNMEKNRANHEYAARYALANGFRLSLQLHLYASMA